MLEDVPAAAPGDRASVRTLLEALLEEGLRGQAIERLSAQLDGAGQDRDWRLELLLRRAELHSEGGELRASVEDLEAALELDRERVVGRLVDALEALRFEPDEAPRARELTLRLVALEESRGDDVRVRELLSDWLEGHDDDIEVRQRLSALEARAERWEEVANHSERLAALLTGAEQVKAALALDDACARMSAPERARDGLEAVHAAQPESQELRDRLRSLYERAGDDRALAKVLVEDARAQGDAAAKLERLRRAGALYVQSGDSEAAIPVLVEVIALAPDDREVVLTLAEARARSGQLTEAIAALTGLIERQGDAPHLDLLRRRAALYEEAGADSEALADLERAHGQDPAGNAEALEALLESLRDRAHKAGDEARESTFAMRLVELLAGQGRRDEARAQLTVWLDHAPEDLAGLRRLRALEIADERWEEVFELCERLVPLEEGEAQLEVARALVDAARRLDRHTDARDGLEIVRRAQPESAELREELRQIYELQGASQELAAILLDDAHVTEDPAQRLALLRRAGALLSEVGDSQTAIPVLREVYTLDPTDHENVITLLDSYLMSALLEEADALLDDIIASFKKRRTPELALFYHYKARIASARQDRLKELEHLQNAFTCDKDNGQVAAELVDLAEALENWDLATKTLRAIAMMKDECECPITRAEAYYRQGRISKILGDEKRAVFWARRAHTEDPELEAAVALLHDLGADV
ncbi:MAG: tetratricopeptide repeat protein [Nannocystaceae bacterium]